MSALHFSCDPGNFVAELTSGRFPMFSTLVQLIEYAGLEGLLSRLENIYVLCPTNDAFERAGITACPPKLGNRLLKPEEVRSVLSTHVMPGARDRYGGNLRGFGTSSTLNGSLIAFEHDENMRTTVRGRTLSPENTTACVLMQGFTSTNARFAGIGRVLV